MKKILTKLMIFVITIFLVLVIGFNYKVRVHTSHVELESLSADYFWQIEQLSIQSQRNIEEVKEDFSKNCLLHARSAAYVIQNQKKISHDVDELRKLASILDVDELHLFSPQGEIISGTHPEYYHLTFNSGEQMHFFAPMLEDYSLELCQEITPNTAENKMMQYAAVWMEDKSGIIQIGMKPERVLQLTEENSLSNILSLVPTERQSTLFVIDSANGNILASTKKSSEGKNADSYGIAWKNLRDKKTHLSHITLKGTKHCLVTQRLNDMVYARTYPSSFIVNSVLMDTGFLLLYFFLFSLIALFIILYYMDSKLIRGLSKINRQLSEIGRGEINSVSHQSHIPELSVLTTHINDMLQSVRNAFRSFSLAIEKSYLPIGVFELSTSNQRSFTNSKIWNILMVPEERQENTPENIAQLTAIIVRLKEHPVDVDGQIYLLTADDAYRYIHLEEFDYDSNHVILVIDVSDHWQEKEELRQQRDNDILTNLYNRRGFIEKTSYLFQHRELLRCAAMIMLDSDGLKSVNDQYGHSTGDEYLSRIAQIILSASGHSSICARLGGDEFAILLYGFSTSEEVYAVIHHLEEENDKHTLPDPDGKTITIRYSIGYAICPDESEDYHTLMHFADMRMYDKKRKRQENTTPRS